MNGNVNIYGMKRKDFETLRPFMLSSHASKVTRNY